MSPDLLETLRAMQADGSLKKLAEELTIDAAIKRLARALIHLAPDVSRMALETTRARIAELERERDALRLAVNDYLNAHHVNADIGSPTSQETVRAEAAALGRLETAVRGPAAEERR